MHTLQTRFLVAILALAVTTPLVLYLQYDVPAGQSFESLRDKVPATIGTWHQVAERGPTEDEKRILETDAILTRTYSRGEGPNCDLSITFARDNRRVAHPPEICYKGSGWGVEEKEVVELSIDGQPFYVNRLLLIRGNSRLHVFYWFKAGPSNSASYLAMQWNIIKLHFTHRGSGSALLRLTATSTHAEDDKPALAALREFAAVAIPVASDAVQ
jgi:EpsI family protein